MNKGCLTPLTHSQTHSSREERGGRRLPGRGQESYFPVGARFTYARWKISRDPLCSKVPVVEVAVLCVPLRPMKGGRSMLCTYTHTPTVTTDTRELGEVLVLQLDFRDGITGVCPNCTL